MLISVRKLRIVMARDRASLNYEVTLSILSPMHSSDRKVTNYKRESNGCLKFMDTLPATESQVHRVLPC